MSCTTCSASFGVFRKEVGCPGCGFSHCSRCLQFKAEGIKGGVCRRCGQGGGVEPRPPPDVLLRRLESLEGPAPPPVTVYTQQPPQTLLEAAMPPPPPTDAELRGRLDHLRRPPVAPPTIPEIEERLAQLQGRTHPAPSGSQDLLLTRPPKTEAEETHDLIQQAMAEAALNRRYEGAWEAEMEARLAKLRGDAPRQSLMDQTPGEAAAEAPQDADSFMKQMHADASDEDGDEEHQVKKLIAKLALKEKLRIDDSEASEEELISDSEQSELPWCCICNENATLRCPECSGDLFCNGCFREGHFDDPHKPIPFTRKRANS